MRDVRIVLGFSPGLVRPCHADPIRFIESSKVHDAVNKIMFFPTDSPPEEILAFMSLDEIRKLLEIDNVRLAMHGCMHLKLERISGKIQRLAAFRRDFNEGVDLFKRYNLTSNIFVYPYAFCEDGYDHIVKKSGFRESYAKPGAYRIAVENLVDEHTGIEDS